MLARMLGLLAVILAFPIVPAWASPAPLIDLHAANQTRRPLVLWHGLGDSHSSPGMLGFANEIKEIHPGIFIHSIYVEEDLEADQKAGWFGNVNKQIDLVAEQLKGIEELKDGFDAIGFSQGGQFLRAYIERYNSPPIHNLITFGSQHMGVSDLPTCSPGPGYIWCQLARRAARSSVYGEWSQQNLVQAQYYRDPEQLPAYLLANGFLADVNNELPEDYNLVSSRPSPSPKTRRNETYARNLASLNKFIMVLFTEDRTVVPKESSWFGSYAPSESVMAGQDERKQVPQVVAAKTIIPMRLQPLYMLDAIGLRTLDERGDVLLETCEAEHMQMNRICWEGLVKEWVGEEV